VNNVLHFPLPREHVAIESGWVRGTNPPTPLRFEYWIDWHESDGACTCVWWGETLAEAQNMAAYWASNGVLVVDKTGRRH
jgi:hypothetical protein